MNHSFSIVRETTSQDATKGMNKGRQAMNMN